MTQPAIDGTLYGVACTSPSSCVAVGYNGSALIEAWNGSSWSTSATPNDPNSAPLLYSVSCAGPSSCVAVGYDHTSTGGNDALVETWNGTTWSITPSPDPSTGSFGINVLSGVSCPDSNDCLAVGYYETSTAGQTLVESWDGTSWTVTPSPSPGSVFNMLKAISCTSSTSCVAVGTAGAVPGAGVTLIQTWNGNGWFTSPSPNQGSNDTLLSTSCPSAGSCFAVGSDIATSGTTQTLVESAVLPPGTQPPACAGNATRCISSSPSKSVTQGASFSFLVQTVGSPSPKIKKKGKLPKGVSLHNNGNGTAILGGSPTLKKGQTSAVFHVTLTATFGKGKSKQVVSQAFTLTVT